MESQKTDIKSVIQEKTQEKRDEKYNQYVKENTPKKSWFINLCKAYLIGGLICVLGQLFTNLYMMIGLE